MGLLEIANDGTLSGTLAVTIVPAPAAQTRRVVKNITIQNRDTANVALTLQYVNGASTRQICNVTLTSGDTMICGEEDFYVLDTNAKSIQAVLASNPATTNPDFVAAYADVTWATTIAGLAGGVLTGTYPNPSLVSGAIQSGNIASGAILSGSVIGFTIGSGAIQSGNIASGVIAGYPILDTGMINGFPVTYVTSNQIAVGFLNQTTASVCRDSLDVTPIVMSGYKVISTTVNGALGIDFQNVAGTCFTKNADPLISGTGTNFLTVFGAGRSLGAQVVASGVQLVGFSGTNFGLSYNLAVGDLIGSSGGPFYSVTSIASGIVGITSGSIASGTVPIILENPTFVMSGLTSFNRVTAIYSNTSMRTQIFGQYNSNSGQGSIGGMVTAVSLQYMFPWVGQGSNGVTAFLSTQRTTPYGPAGGGYSSGVRRLGSVFILSGNIVPFTQDGLANHRTSMFQVTLGAFRPISNFQSTSWTDFAFGNTCVPPTATAVWGNGQFAGTQATTAASVRPRSVFVSGISAALAMYNPGTNAFSTELLRIPCDSAQYISAIQAGTSGSLYMDVCGYDEDV